MDSPPVLSQYQGMDTPRSDDATMPLPVKDDRIIIPPETSSLRRAILLAIFCLALFVDAFMTSAMIICLDSIGIQFNAVSSDLQWLLTAYNLTFGSFLLLAGRVSDIYHPKPVFIAGFLLIGILGIGAGFVKTLVGLIVIRAFQGIGAAMTIPSATLMLTAAYTSPLAQGIALTFFAAAGTLGLCLGFVLGGVIVQEATWHWVVWIVPIITVPLSAVSLFLIPWTKRSRNKNAGRMDFLGVVILTASLILLIFSLSQAPVTGWGTVRVLLPLVISILLLVTFFLWQTRLDDHHALIPSKMWFIPNFIVLVMVSFCTQIYLTGPILILSQYWPDVYGWSSLSIGLHVLPMGVASTIVCVILPKWLLALPPRIALVCSNAMAGLFSILFVYSSARERYWSYTFPGMVLITAGSSAGYILSNVGLITSVPASKIGVAAAIFSAAQQVGGAINIAIITTISNQVQNDHPYPSYRSAASGFWFIVALGVAQAIIVAAFYKPKTREVEGGEENSEEKTDGQEKGSETVIVSSA